MKEQNIPSWIWIIIAVLVLIIVLLMLNMPSDKEVTTTTTDGEHNTITTYKEDDTRTKKINPLIYQ